jgi:hypothetical protein
MTTENATPTRQDAPNVDQAPTRIGSSFGGSLCWQIYFRADAKINVDVVARREYKRIMTTTLTRDQISMEAYKIARQIKARAEAAWNTSAESKLWALVGIAERLNNDACECGNTKKSLMKRLAALRKEAA